MTDNGSGIVRLTVNTELSDEQYMVLLGILRTSGKDLPAHIQQLLAWEVEVRRFYGGAKGLVELSKELIREHAIANSNTTPERLQEVEKLKQMLIRLGVMEAE